MHVDFHSHRPRRTLVVSRGAKDSTGLRCAGDGNQICAARVIPTAGTRVRGFVHGRDKMKNKRLFEHLALRLVLPAALLAAVAGCTLLQDAATRLPGPRLYEKGAVVIDGIRDFERRIGFRPTDNFADLDKETESYPFCGTVSSLHLPYSYEDPAIRWIDTPTEEECRTLAGPDADVYFGQTEAVGEQGTPVTTAMLSGSLVRFVYLVFHEDCHDQFELPCGIEEAAVQRHRLPRHGGVCGGAGAVLALERVALRRYAGAGVRTHPPGEGVLRSARGALRAPRAQGNPGARRCWRSARGSSRGRNARSRGRRARSTTWASPTT